MEAISFENVSFKYSGSKEDILSEISFTVQQGELVLLCGRSGSGKSTLLRLIKRQLTPNGELSGSILLFGKPADRLSERDSVSKIGFVMQNSDGQLVTESVYRELAFGLESLGVPNGEIRRRAAETSMYFGIEKLYRCKTTALSGGEKQLVNLASVIVTEPAVLLLDEPTSQLDPIAAEELISYVIRLNRELGITVIICEHRSDNIFSFADRVLCLDSGKLTVNAVPEKAASDSAMFSGALPSAALIYKALGESDGKVLNTVQCRRFICNNYICKAGLDETALETAKKSRIKGECAVKLRDIRFGYDRSGGEILKGLTLDIYKGEILAILGGNGAGKTTLLKIISKLEKPYSGRIAFQKNSDKRGKSPIIAMLPQDPRDLFITENVFDDILITAKNAETDERKADELALSVCKMFELEDLIDRHPYDLSGGEIQRAALAKLFALSPDILLLDEPTKGMDSDAAYASAQLIKKLKAEGKTVVIVTHDTQTAAQCADRCALLFDGEIVSDAPYRTFFSELAHYTTPQARISRGIVYGAVTTEELCSSLIAKERAGDRL